MKSLQGPERPCVGLDCYSDLTTHTTTESTIEDAGDTPPADIEASVNDPLAAAVVFLVPLIMALLSLIFSRNTK